MAGAFDISGFNYGYGSNPAVTPMASPAVPAAAAGFGTGIGGVGASNPSAAAIQSFSGGTGSSGLLGSGGSGIPGAAGSQIPGLGFNIPTLNLALGGIQAIGNIWGAWQANKLAKEQFAFQKDVTETNLANQIQAYNTTLEDRIRSRAYVEKGQPGGLKQSQVAGYLDEHRLSRQRSA